jgi:membrane associated rhomboid family serine protease
MFPIHDDTERIHGRPWLNYGLIFTNVAVFIWQVLTDPSCLLGCSDPQLVYQYGSVPDVIFNDPARGIPSIFTSMFMHGGIAHIVGNMVFLWVFGDNIEDKFGRVKYIIIYLGWGVAAALLHSAFAVSTDEGMIPAVGASGAISGILGAYVLMFPRAKIHTIITAFFIYTVRIPVLVYIPFWFVLQVIFGVIGQLGIGGESSVAYLAHIGGFIAGVATGLVGRMIIVPRLAAMAGKGTTYKPPGRKIRPKIEDVIADSPPEVIEGPGSYEVIAEIRGVSDASAIKATYDPAAKLVKITASGARKYETYAKMPDTAEGVSVQYIQYLNGIARIRLAKA